MTHNGLKVCWYCI